MKRNRFFKSVAVIISTVSTPFFVLGLSLLLGNWVLINEQREQAIIFLIVNVTLPVIFYLQLLIQNKKHPFHLATVNRKQRYLIFLSAVFSSLISTILFMLTMQDYRWSSLSMVLCILFAAYYMINRYIDKLSLHAGIFAFCMIYLTDKVSIFFVIMLAALPIIFWSRIKLHQHTWFQLLLGSAIGMFIGLLTWTI